MTRRQKGHSGGFLCTSHRLMAHSTAAQGTPTSAAIGSDQVLLQSAVCNISYAWEVSALLCAGQAAVVGSHEAALQ